MKRSTTIPLSAGIVLAASLAVAGPVWEEDNSGGGDAGGTADGAQSTAGSGQLGRIHGKLTGGAGPLPDLEDMYLIRICDVKEFLASTAQVENGGAEFDTQLWLFRPDSNQPLDIFGVVANDDHPNAPTDRSRIDALPTDGSPPTLTPGRYFLAVSGAGRLPVSGALPGGRIFLFEEPNEISGPDGPGSDDPHQGWLFEGNEPAVGDYQIALAGVTFGSTGDIDCNKNGFADACDIAMGFSLDENGNGIPDECEFVLIGDVDGDGDVDFEDLVALLASWGPCPPPPCPADFDGSGAVGFSDLLALLANFGL